MRCFRRTNVTFFGKDHSYPGIFSFHTPTILRWEFFGISAIRPNVKCSCEDISVSCVAAKAGVNEGGRRDFRRILWGGFLGCNSGGDESRDGGHARIVQYRSKKYPEQICII